MTGLINRVGLIRPAACTSLHQAEKTSRQLWAIPRNISPEPRLQSLTAKGPGNLTLSFFPGCQGPRVSCLKRHLCLISSCIDVAIQRRSTCDMHVA